MYQVATFFGPIRLRKISGLPSVNHLAGEHRSRQCSLGTYQKERPRRRIHTIRREKIAKEELPSGLLLCLWISNAACLQPRRAVIPDERWRSCQSSKATARDPTDDRERCRLPNREPWPDLSLNGETLSFPLQTLLSRVFCDVLTNRKTCVYLEPLYVWIDWRVCLVFWGEKIERGATSPANKRLLSF